MLKNQDVVPEPPVSVAQARVTPDELAKALAAIEARRQADAAHLAETIPIEQAVSDLHLDSTSDEIWAEVQAQRAKATTVREPLPRLKPQQAVQPVNAGQFARRRGWRVLLPPILVLGVLMSVGIIPHNFGPHGFSPSLVTPKNTPVADSTLRPLSTIANGVEVYASDATLLQISKGKPAGQVLVSKDPDGTQWTLVRMDGHVYVRGFTVRADSLTTLAGNALPVYNDDDSGEFHDKATSNITLRVDGIPLERSGGDGDYSSIIVPNFRPDPFTTLTPGR